MQEGKFNYLSSTFFFPFTLREGPQEGVKGRGSEEIRVGGGGSLSVMGEHGGPLCPLFDLSL